MNSGDAVSSVSTSTVLLDRVRQPARSIISV